MTIIYVNSLHQVNVFYNKLLRWMHWLFLQNTFDENIRKRLKEITDCIFFTHHVTNFALTRQESYICKIYSDKRDRLFQCFHISLL